MNPAERVLTIYDKLVSQQKDQPMTQTWSEVFGLEGNSPTLEDDVTACLVGLRSQIDFTRLRLTAVGVSPDLTSPGFERMKDTASPAKLHQSWNGLRGNIQAPECRHAFTWASWVLREDVEDEISSESMTELLAELQSLEAALVDTEMSPYLRDFIQRQVDAIRSALRNYGVQGVRPLREAMRMLLVIFLSSRHRFTVKAIRHLKKPKAF